MLQMTNSNAGFYPSHTMYQLSIQKSHSKKKKKVSKVWKRKSLMKVRKEVSA